MSVFDYTRTFDVSRDEADLLKTAVSELLDQRVAFEVGYSYRDYVDDNGFKNVSTIATVSTTRYGIVYLNTILMTDDEMAEAITEALMTNDRSDLHDIVRSLLLERYDGAQYSSLQEEYIDFLADTLP